VYDTLILEKEGTIGIIKLNRPPVNPFNYAAIDNLNKALYELDNDRTIKVIVITGMGDIAFSAGFDIKSFGDPMIAWHGTYGQMVFNKIERGSKPVIAAINGFALGGGFELATACHFRIMVDAQKAVLGLPEVTLGIIPGWGGTQRLPGLVGRARALEIALMGRRIQARESYEWGLINKVSRPGEVLNDAREYATTLVIKAPLALKWILNSIILGADTNMAGGIEIETANSAVAGLSRDAFEGMSAFVEKREVKFTGE
jgi:enoyl-CoA hydratase/carnithine racemase